MGTLGTGDVGTKTFTTKVMWGLTPGDEDWIGTYVTPSVCQGSSNNFDCTAFNSLEFVGEAAGDALEVNNLLITFVSATAAAETGAAVSLFSMPTFSSNFGGKCLKASLTTIECYGIPDITSSFTPKFWIKVALDYSVSGVVEVTVDFKQEDKLIISYTGDVGRVAVTLDAGAMEYAESDANVVLPFEYLKGNDNGFIQWSDGGTEGEHLGGATVFD